MIERHEPIYKNLIFNRLTYIIFDYFGILRAVNPYKLPIQLMANYAWNQGKNTLGLLPYFVMININLLFRKIL